MNRFALLQVGRLKTSEKSLLWKFTGWPNGDFEIELNLSSGTNPEGTPAIVIDLAKSKVPDFVFLFPMFYQTGARLGDMIYITEDHEGLTATIDNDRYLLFRPVIILPGIFAWLDVGPGPAPTDPAYSGQFEYQRVTDW